MPLCDVGKAPSQWFNMMACWDDGYPVISDVRRCLLSIYGRLTSLIFSHQGRRPRD